jgi:hypothetical protein
MLQQLLPIGFLAIFQLIGGLVAGDGLRMVFVKHAPGGIFLIVWGLFFGGVPALIGVAAAAGTRQPLLALVGPGVFIGALVFGMLLLPWIVQEYGAGTTLTLAVGCLFLLVGGSTVVGIVRAGTGATIVGLIIGAIFGLVGLLLCWTSVSPLLHGQKLDAK